MIDIHNHLIWGVDDGARDIDETINMIETAYAQGITRIIATPHFYIDTYEPNKEDLYEKKVLLEDRLGELNLPVSIKIGEEIYLEPASFEKIESNIALSIDNLKYILVEFSFNDISLFIFELLVKLVDMGYIPIIAHPERYKSVQTDFSLLEKFVDTGCILQLNGGSILGNHGRGAKKAAKYMVKHRLFHIVGSDAHNDTNRPFVIAKAFKKIKDQDFKNFLETNAEAIWNNQRIDSYRYFQ
ncbi:hypothetical protein MT340_000350 [Staphylococcus sp. NRL 16/872]|uniref:tyrosine-protein phosphatase n=1 Tax=Staphylococcus sp. NRL 16/872 TaxID=2930131 RepID=UPI001FB2ECA1|nr:MULTISPECIES: CpsB/CapC family capsule biosynthesis tyrosine phosphatase [unclassified Staphylococcus]MCJ1655234.1 hypothetical protein [Staphylococcus sp. NRL 21/187]MCJ1661067.1 hypothetical protein [Staphylococcus sp. NRL 18/288]MCJ1666965.1 hypothetical protein [Staphylococcus sp. NRL 19/737]WEN69437.1 hypothetical protein MT340_000350 [Staphylococcus sp. NRL 16/872]